MRNTAEYEISVCVFENWKAVKKINAQTRTLEANEKKNWIILFLFSRTIIT